MFNTFKSEIAPKGMKFNVNDFLISDKYATILTIISYPKLIQPGFLANITNLPGVKVVVKHIPIQFSTMSRMINKEIADLKQRFQTEKERTIQERIRQDYESLESFVQMLAATQSKIFDFQMHVMITADSKEELENKKIQIRNFLDAVGMRGIPMMFEQEKVLKSMIPIFPKQDIEERVGTPIPSPTIAAMYPFVFDSIKDPGLSTLLGVDFSGGVVLFNQFLYQSKKEFNRNNANLIILGSSGSGKSTAAKLMLRTHIRNGCKIIAIDPEGELEEMTKNLGGDFIDLGKGGKFGMVNPLEVSIDADEEDLKEGLGYTVLTRTLQSLKAFMKYYTPSIEEDVLAMFSEVVQDTYKRFHIDFETDFTNFTSKDFPTFDDVYSTIKGRLLSMPEATREKDVLERLELKIRPFVNELKFYFNGHTTIETDSEFIVFNIKELMNSDENIRNALFFNILKYAWGLCLDKNTNTVMFVDEAHVLLSSRNELGAEFLAQIQRRSRKYNTGTIIITQQPTDFAAPNIIVHGKAIFDNAAYYLVMGLKKQAVEDLSKLIDINENEKESIKSYSQGQALFVCGSRRMIINVVLTQDELDSFGTGGGL
ncbi:MAG: ATP-binding protein [Bacilli bacterium]|nr:ATP-binding protein [Bacilli bacterium]